jgi:YVTN family beta-propeller protein
MHKTISVAAMALAGVLAAVSQMRAQNKPDYRVQAEYKLEGAAPAGDLWLDSSSRRLFVSRGDRIEVLNADNGRSEGSIPAQGSAGIVVVDDESRGFFANRAAGSVTVFNSTTLTVVKTIPLGAKDPESVVYDADAHRVFVVAPGSNEVIPLDAESGAVEGRVTLQGHLRQAVTNGMGSLFVAAEDRNAIHVVDTHTLKFLGDFPSGDAEGPVSLAIDPSGRRLFAACSGGELAVIDTDIGFTFEELPIATGDPSSVFTFTPQGKGGWKGADFVAGDAGTLTLVQMNAFIRYSIGGKLTIPSGVRAVAYDPQTHRIFLAVSGASPEVLALAPAIAGVTQ